MSSFCLTHSVAGSPLLGHNRKDMVTTWMVVFLLLVLNLITGALQLTSHTQLERAKNWHLYKGKSDEYPIPCTVINDCSQPFNSGAFCHPVEERWADHSNTYWNEGFYTWDLQTLVTWQICCFAHKEIQTTVKWNWPTFLALICKADLWYCSLTWELQFVQLNICWQSQSTQIEHRICWSVHMMCDFSDIVSNIRI